MSACGKAVPRLDAELHHRILARPRAARAGEITSSVQASDRVRRLSSGALASAKPTLREQYLRPVDFQSTMTRIQLAVIFARPTFEFGKGCPS